MSSNSGTCLIFFIRFLKTWKLVMSHLVLVELFLACTFLQIQLDLFDLSEIFLFYLMESKVLSSLDHLNRLLLINSLFLITSYQ